MDVKPGYKQTEVGVIPEDWNAKPFAEIGQFRTGPFGTSLRANEYYANEGVPLVSVRDIGEGMLTFDEHTPLVPPSVIRRLSEYVLNSGDIVFGRKGSVDRSAIVKESQAGCFLGSDGIRVRPSKACNALFIAYQLQRKEIQAWLLQNATGTTMASMNQGILRRIIVPLPSLAEQQAIAEVLSDADALIASLEQLIAKKRQVKQGAMQELLTGRRRLPGFSGEWVVKRLGEVVDKFVNGGTPSTQHPEYWTGQIPWITGADILGQQVSEIRRYITEDAVRNSSTNVIEKGNLLLVSRTGVGKLAIAPFAVAISQDFTGVYARQDRLIPEFLFRFFDYNSDLLRQQNQGTSIQGITRETLALTPIPVPQLAEQAAIAAILSDMDAELAALEAKLAKARQVKQGMMQELLTGRIRLV